MLPSFKTTQHAAVAMFFLTCFLWVVPRFAENHDPEFQVDGQRLLVGLVHLLNNYTEWLQNEVMRLVQAGHNPDENDESFDIYEERVDLCRVIKTAGVDGK